jgi:hypothetical protein
VQSIEPLLDFKLFNVLRDPVAPLRNQYVADVVLKDGLRVLRLRTCCDLRVEFDFEVILRKLAELQSASFRIGTVDPYSESEARRPTFPCSSFKMRSHSIRSSGVPVV